MDRESGGRGRSISRSRSSVQSCKQGPVRCLTSVMHTPWTNTWYRSGSFLATHLTHSTPSLSVQLVNPNVGKLPVSSTASGAALTGATFRAASAPDHSDLPRRHARETAPPCQDTAHLVLNGSLAGGGLQGQISTLLLTAPPCQDTAHLVGRTCGVCGGGGGAHPSLGPGQ